MKEETAAARKRRSEIELLRLFALYGVLILHYMHNGSGCGFAIDHAVSCGIDTPFFKILRALFMGSVDLFFLISGYCAFQRNKITYKKTLLLVLTLMTSKLVRYLVNMILGCTAFSFAGLIFELTPADYFVVLYCVIYFFSPYINRFLEALSDRELLRFVIAGFLIFSIWAFVIDLLAAPGDSAWWRFLNPIGPVATQRGYTVLNFFFLYVAGAMARREYFFQKWKPAVWGTIYLVCSAVTYLLSNTNAALDIVYAYNSPFTFAGAFALFMLFTRRKIQSDGINRLAQPVFFIYTFHWGIYSLLGIETVMKIGNHLLMVVHGLLVPAAVYLICIPAYVLCKPYIFGLMKLFPEKKQQKEDS